MGPLIYFADLLGFLRCSDEKGMMFMPTNFLHELPAGQWCSLLCALIVPSDRLNTRPSYAQLLAHFRPIWLKFVDSLLRGFATENGSWVWVSASDLSPLHAIRATTSAVWRPDLFVRTKTQEEARILHAHVQG